MTTRQLCVILGLTLVLIVASLELLRWKRRQDQLQIHPRTSVTYKYAYNHISLGVCDKPEGELCEVPKWYIFSDQKDRFGFPCNEAISFSYVVSEEFVRKRWEDCR